MALCAVISYRAVACTSTHRTGRCSTVVPAPLLHRCAGSSATTKQLTRQLKPCVAAKRALHELLHHTVSLQLFVGSKASISSLCAPQVLPSTCRAMVGQVAGGGRTEKPLLKAGNAYHKFKVKRNSWPKVRFSLD